MYAKHRQHPFINKKQLLTRHHRGDIIRVENDMNNGFSTDDDENHFRRGSKRFNEFTFESTRQFGPIKQRKCTDCGCLFIFIVFIGLWAGMIAY
ncbi:hypothetical protein BLA29_014376, partial [Euroglyphus maynei]